MDSGFQRPMVGTRFVRQFNLSRRSRIKYQKLEEVLDNSDVLVTVSETWVDSFKRLGSKNVKLITNGFDEDDFNVLQKKVTLLYWKILDC